MQKYFTFDSYQLVRVIVTWVLFVLSVVGNIFVLISIGGQREKWSNNYIVMFNVALADLLYACTVLPIGEYGIFEDRFGLLSTSLYN